MTQVVHASATPWQQLKNVGETHGFYYENNITNNVTSTFENCQVNSHVWVLLINLLPNPITLERKLEPTCRPKTRPYHVQINTHTVHTYPSPGKIFIENGL